nr:SAM-dependent methyltransferase [Chloroflexota bacterium]
MSKDWVRWHGQYERDTPLRQRLAIVQRLIGDVLAARSEALLRAISVCSGDGRDLLGALAQSSGRERV